MDLFNIHMDRDNKEAATTRAGQNHELYIMTFKKLVSTFLLV